MCLDNIGLDIKYMITLSLSVSEQNGTVPEMVQIQDLTVNGVPLEYSFMNSKSIMFYMCKFS